MPNSITLKISNRSSRGHCHQHRARPIRKVIIGPNKPKQRRVVKVAVGNKQIHHHHHHHHTPWYRAVFKWFW